MKILQKKKGITLIALVITIVIMLLLAAVAIQMAIGNNRTYNKINRGKKRTSEIWIIWNSKNWIFKFKNKSNRGRETRATNKWSIIYN